MYPMAVGDIFISHEVIEEDKESNYLSPKKINFSVTVFVSVEVQI
jgi:ssRNA-specific RNase YbeY (16S rRNA maturation enzyme)